MTGKVISLLGLQWGDEGKGKVVDNIAKDISAAVRYQGGHNAGHTLIVEEKTMVFHLLPSAICHENIRCYLGRGVVVSLEPKYWVSMSFCLSSKSFSTSQPIVTPQPPQGFDMVQALMPLSYSSAMAGSRSFGLCSRRR